MKKLILMMLSIVMIVSCSKDKAEEKKSAINPPAWIQGEWVSELKSVFIFTKDDLCTGHSQIVCFNGSYEVAHQESTETTYKISLHPKGLPQVTQKYEFKKISATEIEEVIKEERYKKK